VLVVDDTRDSREMYMEYLEFVGFRVSGAEEGSAAIELARSLRPSIIVMDLSLPGMDGWRSTRILKADPDTCDIPIIALTAHVDSASQARAVLAGCDLFVTKPSLPGELEAHIRQLLEARVERGGAAR
jgi:CheY-like chemotaxis protein